MSAPAPSLLPSLSIEPRALASRDRRLAAALIDGLSWAIPFLVAYHFCRRLMMPAAPIAFRSEQELLLIAAALPVWLYQWRLIARTGQSIGKRWLRIEIVRVEGAPQPGWLHGVILRDWVPRGLFIAWYIVSGPDNHADELLSLAMYVTIFGAQRRCLYDYVAGTQVVVASDGQPQR